MDISRSKVLYRSFAGEMPIMKCGLEGTLFGTDGRQYLDMSSSACMSILGHSNKQVIRRIKEQLDAAPNIFGGFWASHAAEHAGALMAEQLGPWFDKVHFVNGGGEAVDLACKLAYQYHAEAKKRSTTYFVSLEYSYHGVGLLPFALTGDYPRYELIQPYHEVIVDNYGCLVTHPYVNGDDEAIEDLRRTVEAIRPAAVIIEPVGGPPLGAFPHTTSYLKAVRALCDEFNALMICDEILCGSGRCGSLAYCDLIGVAPDILLLGKGLSAGYIPMSAIAISKKVSERIAKGSGSIMFGTANSNHTTGCAAVAATIETFKTEGLYEHVRLNGRKLLSLLTEHVLPLRGVKVIRGCGYLYGIDLCDPDEGTFMPAASAFHAVARKCIYEQGAVVYTKGQTVDGSGDFITVAPPAIMSDELMEDGVIKIAEGLKQAFATVGM